MIDNALILAGGKGKRCWPLTENNSKVLLPVVGIPIIIHQINRFKNIGVKNIFIVVDHESSDVIPIVESYGIKNVVFIYQKKQLGTGHAISKARKHISGYFYCLNADTLISESYFELIKDMNDQPFISVKYKDNCSNYGFVEMKKDSFQSIQEKSVNKPGYVNAGLFLFSENIFNAIDKIKKSSRGEYEITDALRLIKDELTVKVIDGYCQDIGYPWDLLNANEKYIQGIENINHGKIEINVSINGKLFLGDNSLIKSGVYIEGPVWIGKYCSIGPNSFLRPGTILCGNNKIGASCEIKNSIIFDGANIPHHNYIGDSIIGEGCNFGAGTKTANVRHDKKKIRVNYRNSIQNTGRKKFGVIMGDNVNMGINCSINPGTLIENNTNIMPGTMISGIIKTT